MYTVTVCIVDAVKAYTVADTVHGPPIPEKNWEQRKNPNKLNYHEKPPCLY